jgi:ABC-type lipoprotein export system ATPase subunit
VIHLNQITKSYRGGAESVQVLHGLSFTLARGQFAAIMGPSGSGKSTLMNILGFMDVPDSGTYLLDGQDLSGADDEALSAVRNQKIGFVFQQFHLLPRLSARDQVMLPLLYADHEVADGEARALRALEVVGLGHRASHTPEELSGGEQQRVAIARALILDPVLVLADEPTGNLDEANAAEVLKILRAIADQGRTVVMVTHDATVAARADRILVLQAGRIAADSPPPVAAATS